jgi:hypothetical protein
MKSKDGIVYVAPVAKNAKRTNITSSEITMAAGVADGVSFIVRLNALSAPLKQLPNAHNDVLKDYFRIYIY